MMGLFTGFSLISGLEILYWLWFKVRKNKKISVLQIHNSFKNFQLFQVLIRGGEDNKSEPVGTITVKSLKDKEVRVFEEAEDKEIADIRAKIGKLTERVVRMEQDTQHIK